MLLGRQVTLLIATPRPGATTINFDQSFKKHVTTSIEKGMLSTVNQALSASSRSRLLSQPS